MTCLNEQVSKYTRMHTQESQDISQIQVFSESLAPSLKLDQV